MVNNDPIIVTIAEAIKYLYSACAISPTGGSPEEDLRLLAEAVNNSVGKGDTHSFEKVFEIVEHFVIFGTDEARDVLIVHFLEELKNLAVVSDFDPAVYENWLGPESHRAWRWLEKKWRGATSLADEAQKHRNLIGDHNG